MQSSAAESMSERFHWREAICGISFMDVFSAFCDEAAGRVRDRRKDAGDKNCGEDYI
jgi:hypothetical protein